MDTQTRTNGIDAATLGLGSVLVGSLPVALVTEEAPKLYTVEAVFTRRPEQEEAAEILSTDTRDFIAASGYPHVEVKISDRRLQIVNTNLEELRDGLATVIADRLAGISATVRARQDAAAIVFQDAATKENERTAIVTALAESVTFDVSQNAEAPQGE